MLALLRLFGFDLERRLHVLRSWAGEFVRLNTENAKDEVRRLALSLGLAAAAGLLALGAFAVLLIALYDWLAAHYGPGIGYGVVAGILALISLMLFLRAARRDDRDEGFTLQYPPAQPYPDEAKIGAAEPAPASRFASTTSSRPLAFGDWKNPLAGVLSEAYAAVPQTGTPVDRVIDEVLQQASQSSAQTVDAAADMIRTGSRKTVVGVLAGAAVLGFLLARRQST